MSAAEQSDGWIDWAGGECPVESDELIEVIDRDGHRWSAKKAGFHYWRHLASPDDVVAYRAVPA